MLNLLFACLVSIFSTSSYSVNTYLDTDFERSTPSIKCESPYLDSIYYLSSDDFGFVKFYDGVVRSFGATMMLDNTSDFVYDFTGSQVANINYFVIDDSDNLNTYGRGSITSVRVGKEVKTHYVNYFLNFYCDGSYGVSVFGCDYFVYNHVEYNSVPLNDIITTQYWYINTSSSWTAYLRGLVVQMGNGGGYDLWDWFCRSYEETLTPIAYDNGYDVGYNAGYQNGYGVGYTAGSSVDSTASTIFTGILDVALIPVNVFLTIFNFDVFGINIAGIVSALLTVSVVIIIFRFLFGGKKDD